MLKGDHIFGGDTASVQGGRNTDLAFLCRLEAQKAAGANKKGKKAKTDPTPASAVSAAAPAKGGSPPCLELHTVTANSFKTHGHT